MNFNMNQTWSEAIALVRGNFQLLAIVAGVFLLVPSLLMYIAIPDMGSMMGMSTDPEAMASMMEGLIGPMILYGTIAFLAQIVGYVAMITLMGDDRPTVAQAIMRGVKAIPTLFGALLLFILLYFVGAVVFGLLIGLLAVVLGETLGLILSFVMVIALFLGILYVMTRLSLTIPIIVFENVMNPIKDFTRSWKLTASHSKPIFGFFVLLFIAYMVVSLLVMAVLGAIIGLFGAGSVFLLGIVSGVIGAAFAMVISGILVSIYRQLSGNDGAQVRDVFE